MKDGDYLDWFEQAKIDRTNGMNMNEIAEKYNKSYKTVVGT